jgi:hypothetical protein
MKPKTLTQTFNDGVLKIYRVDNIASPGDLPKEGLVQKLDSAIPYEERIVGITRNSLAKQEQSSIEQLVRIPRINDISVHDVVTLVDGKQYDVYQAQYINDVEPKCIDLSLTRLEVAYEFAGI